MKIIFLVGSSEISQLAQLFANNGFDVCSVTGTVDQEDLNYFNADAAILDMRIPSAKSTLKKLRQQECHIPLVCFVPNTTPEQNAEMWDMGADDVVPLVFSRVELFARLRAVIRRNNRHLTSTIRHGQLELDTCNSVFKVCGKNVNLTNKEYQIMESMMLRKGTTLSKEYFISRLYDQSTEPNSELIDVFMCKLRKKLKKAGADPVIQTVWGRGYRLMESAE